MKRGKVMRYSPSLACASQINMIKDLRALDSSGIDMFHIDIMDGHYVPNLSLSLDLLREIKMEFPQIELDVHMMVTNPMDYIEKMAKLGVEWLAFHINATNFAHRTISKIKSNGMKAGITINPSESINQILPVIDMVDLVLCMAIEPGFSGQKFIESTYQKIEELSKIREQRNLNFLINVDGGLGIHEAAECAKRGADILVLGMFACFGQEAGVYEALKEFDNNLKGELK